MSSFQDGFIVLAVGLAIGALVAWRLRLRAEPPRAGKDKDEELRVADLEARRDALYEQLSRAEETGVPEGDRRRLERSAARSLRDLEAAGAKLKKKAHKPRTVKEATAASQRAGLRGFALGGGIVALVAVLFVWAGRDATPRPPEDATAPAASAPPERQLSPEAATRAATLEDRLETDAADLVSRKALAELLISEGALFEGFQQSEIILQQSPEDADGLYFQGMVRLMMGQSETAIELLDRSLEQVPGHVSALLVRGLAMLRLGRNDEAITDWEKGLAASGDTHDGLVRLLEMVRSGMGAAEILGTPLPTETRGGMPPPTPGSPTSTVSFSVAISVPEDTRLAPGAVLFVFYRGDTGPGPPAAVRRIDNPRFPVEIQLDQGDSMLGRPLPETGTLSARLDGDGSASTNEPGDLAAEVLAQNGDSVELRLE